DLLNRRVEITGPPDGKKTIKALSCGANVWMADFEDATSPTWDNLIDGQLNLLDAMDRETETTIMVRPRGWHLPECHVRIGGRGGSASLFDFRLYPFHCGGKALEPGRWPHR